MRSAMRFAETPGPARPFGQEVTIRQRSRSCARATAGAATAPRPAPSAARRDGSLVPERMEVMHGPVPMADRQSFRGGDGGADIGLGGGDGLAQANRLGRGRRRWPRTGCSRCRGCCGSRRAAMRSAANPSWSSRMSTLSAPSAWPPLIRTALGPSARIRSAWRATAGLVFRDLLVEERRCLRQVRRDEERFRQEHAAQRLDRLGHEQRIAACRDHHRIEHHRAGAMAVEPARDRLDDRRLREHADLHGVDGKVGEDAVDLSGHEPAGTSWMPCTPRVFCAVRAVITLAP